MNSAEIRSALTDPTVFIHYTSEKDLRIISQSGYLYENSYFTRECVTADDAQMLLFAKLKRQEGKGTHIIVIKFSAYFPVQQISDIYEYISATKIKFTQHNVLYSGRNPFTLTHHTTFGIHG